jgi:hypothetical protein
MIQLSDMRGLRKSLAKQWASYMPTGVPENVAEATGVFLENQNRYFDELEPSVLKRIEEKCGPRKDMLLAIAHVFSRSPLHWMVSVQPILEPFYPVFYAKTTFGPPDPGTTIPTATVTVESEDVTARTRRCTATTGSAPFGLAMSETMDQLSREVAGELLEIAKKTAVSWINDGQRSVSTLKLSTASQVIHRKSMRSPATWLMACPETVKTVFRQDELDKTEVPTFLQRFTEEVHYGRQLVELMGRYFRRWNVVLDPVFPELWVMLGRCGDDFVDAGYIWAPFVFAFDVEADRVGIKWRGTGRLVSEANYATLDIIVGPPPEEKKPACSSSD